MIAGTTAQASMRAMAAIGAMFLSACVSVAAPDEPARRVDPTRESHDELVRAVSATLGVASVTIAEDALIQDGVLLIERTPARDASGQRLDGRSLEKPEQFRLVRHADLCVLVHARSGARSVLERTKCVSMESPSP
jgi:hypothetical protein